MKKIIQQILLVRVFALHITWMISQKVKELESKLKAVWEEKEKLQSKIKSDEDEKKELEAKLKAAEDDEPEEIQSSRPLPFRNLGIFAIFLGIDMVTFFWHWGWILKKISAFIAATGLTGTISTGYLAYMRKY